MGALGEPPDRPPAARETQNGNRFDDGAHSAPLLSTAAEMLEFNDWPAILHSLLMLFRPDFHINIQLFI